MGHLYGGLLFLFMSFIIIGKVLLMQKFKTVKYFRYVFAVWSACSFAVVFIYYFRANAAAMPRESTKSFSCNNMSEAECLASNPILQWLSWASSVLTAFIGVGAVIMITLGGLQYITSRDNAQSVQNAKKKIYNAIIGLAAFIFLWAFLQWIIPGGVFNDGTTSQPVSRSQQAVNQPPKSNNANDSQEAPISRQQVSTITKLSSVDNFRDAGASGYIKKGVLYRSGLLEDANANQLASLLGGGMIIDLRTADKIKQHPDVYVSNIDTRNYPIHGTEDYTEFVTSASSREGFKNAITAIANEDGKVLVHCTYGKDRTGWTIAMIMYAIGATNKQVKTEYLKSPNVSSAMLDAGLSKARDKYGSINNYLKDGLGLSSQTISKLKSKLQV